MILQNAFRTMADQVGEAVTQAGDAAGQAVTEAGHSYPTISFPHLGIDIEELSTGFDVFGIHIAWYGVIIAVGMILAAVLVYGLARRTGQNADDYIDLFIITIIAGIIGARLYYVFFTWDYYSQHPGEIINLRNGGLAIYGGIILGFIAIVIISRIKKMNLLTIIDTCVPGVVIAQAIGRWGNFVNREAFGGYTDNFLAMQIKVNDVGGVINDELSRHIIYNNGVRYVQVHPTFLYESLWCVLVFVLIMIFRKKARYKGEVALWYFGGYALGRVFIEGLRTDSLYIGSSNIAISQLLAFVIFFASLAILIIMRIFIIKEPDKYQYVNLTVPGWRDLKFEKKKKAPKVEDKDEVDANAESPDAGSDSDGSEDADPIAEHEAETVEDHSEELSDGYEEVRDDLTEKKEDI